MKLRFIIGTAAAIFATGFLPGIAVAQTSPAGMPPPPAMAIAQRLVNESQAAADYAVRLDAAKDKIGADFQREIARRRSAQAAAEYGQVVSSATYQSTPYAASAIFLQAEQQFREQQELNPKNPNPNVAIQTFKTLLDAKYEAMDYPEKPRVRPELTSLQILADTQNKTYFPERVFYGIIDFFTSLTGKRPYSYFLALLFISVLAKAAMWPLSNKQYRAMKEMQKLQPVIKEIQAKYKSDPAKLQAKTMEVYAQHGTHPLKGCLPTLLSLPIWWLVYYMVRLYEFQFSHGTFLWIGSSLSHMHATVFGIDLAPAANLSLVDVPLLLLYALSMYIQQKMMPVSPDPQQAEQQRMMILLGPFMSTFFFLRYRMPAAFVLYFLISNILSMAQQQYQNKMRLEDAVAKPALESPALSITTDEPNSGNGTGHARKAPAAASLNGTTPTARGAISPKVHTKKKRR